MTTELGWMIRRRLETCQRGELKEAIQIDIQLQALIITGELA